MKQEMVIKLIVNDSNSRIKALKIAVCCKGSVESVSWGEKDSSHLVVKGHGIDADSLTLLLRKKMGFADLVSLKVIEEKKPEDRKEPDPVVTPIVWSSSYRAPYSNYYYYYPY